MKNKTFPTVGTVPKSNRKIVERNKIGTPSTQINLITVGTLQFV